MLRSVLVVPFGIGLTVVLFWLMAMLIQPKPMQYETTASSVVVDFIRKQTEREPPPPEKENLNENQVDKRPVPEKPELTTPKMHTYDLPTSIADVPLVPLVPQALQGGIDLSALQIAQESPNSGVSSAGFSANLMPIQQTQPIYPERARRRGIEGWVRVSFHIDVEGNVSDVKVIESEPPRIFDRVALKAVSRWKFRPQLIAGIAKPRDVEQKLVFNLDK